MTNLTHDQIQAILLRIEPEYFRDFDTTDWDAFFEFAENKILEGFERFAVLYAESQWALEKMNKKVCRAVYYFMKDSPKHPDGRSKEISYFHHGMDRLMDAKKIARNARKGGK